MEKKQVIRTPVIFVLVSFKFLKETDYENRRFSHGTETKTRAMKFQDVFGSDVTLLATVKQI